MLLVEFCQLLEGVIADNIGVEYEERGIVLPEDLFCQLERTGRPKWFGLNRKFDVDSILLLILREA